MNQCIVFLEPSILLFHDSFLSSLPENVWRWPVGEMRNLRRDGGGHCVVVVSRMYTSYTRQKRKGETCEQFNRERYTSRYYKEKKYNLDILASLFFSNWKKVVWFGIICNTLALVRTQYKIHLYTEKSVPWRTLACIWRSNEGAKCVIHGTVLREQTFVLLVQWTTSSGTQDGRFFVGRKEKEPCASIKD